MIILCYKGHFCIVEILKFLRKFYVHCGFQPENDFLNLNLTEFTRKSKFRHFSDSKITKNCLCHKQLTVFNWKLSKYGNFRANWSNFWLKKVFSGCTTVLQYYILRLLTEVTNFSQLSLLVLFLCSFLFCIVVLSSRTDREKYRTQAHTPLLPPVDNKIADPLSDLTLQESLMLVSAFYSVVSIEILRASNFKKFEFW